MTLLYASLIVSFLLIALFLVRRSHSAESQQRIAAARQRRESQRQPCAEVSARVDNYAIDFTADLNGMEVDERANGFADLSDEQKRIIALTFDGYAVPVIREARRHTGPTVQQRAGVPFASSVWGDLNRVETLDSASK